MEEPKGLELTATAAQIHVSGMPATIRTRANFAGQHFLAAAMFARISGQLETNNAGGSSADPFFTEITGYVTGTLLTASFALEAYINQVFIDGDVFPAPHLGGNTQELWNIWWRQIESKKTLDKYNLALDLKEQAHFTKDSSQPGNHLFLSANLLIDVRNALVHFKPQWDDEQKSHKQITQRLLKEPVNSSPFGSTSPLFPHDFMSHDMARWAVRAAWNFIEAFSQRAELPNKYAHMVNDLNPGYPTWPVP